MKMLDHYELIGGELGKDMSEEEFQQYIDRGRQAHKNLKLTGVTVKMVPDSDDIDISYEYQKTPFERIRRITGYLVGTLDRFNDAKRHEVEDRVKHGLQQSDEFDLEDVYVDEKDEPNT